MQDKDIKILWGRSGNRCTICKLELTPDGNKETLGEMAHIVAKSGDGPRGESELTAQDRDKYNNLILLCPTHHREIDKNHNDWSVDKLHRIKAEHESWVSDQLNSGNISVTTIDNSDFLSMRHATWQDLSRDHITLILSLTPLRITGEFVATMAERSQQCLEQATLPGRSPVESVNRFHTRPTEFGLANENFPVLPGRFGHSYQIFKNGHCEYLHELGRNADRLTERANERGDNLQGAQFAIRYTDYAEAVIAGFAWLRMLWGELLPFEYMELQCMILNCNKTIMYSYKDDWDGGVYGHPLRSDHLVYKNILSKDQDFQLEELDILKWISNCYGLILNNQYDGRGNLQKPVRMR